MLIIALFCFPVILLGFRIPRLTVYRRLYSQVDDFNPSDFIKVLQQGNPSTNLNFENAVINDNFKASGDDDSNEEAIYRKYPFENLRLPVLPDCNNYFSGKFQNDFWHQNADQVVAYIPIADDVSKRDIAIAFDVNSLEIRVKGEVVKKVSLPDKIIPDGSFWVLETDKNNQKYIQLDLEKRFRMINWKHLFGEGKNTGDELTDDDQRRSEMLRKLFAANKGMSALSGQEPESIQEMMRNEDLMKSIDREVNPFPKIVDTEAIEPEVVSDIENELRNSELSNMEIDSIDNVINVDDNN